MVKDYTVMIVAISLCVTVVMAVALMNGHNGVLLDSYLLFMGGLVGAISTHYKMKYDQKKNQAQPPGGE